MLRLPLKGLWYKEYVQARVAIWSTFWTVFFFWTVSVFMELNELRKAVEQYGPQEAAAGIHYLGGNGMLPIVLIVAAFYLGSILIGSERDRRLDDFTLALPYSRERIFLTKWTLAATALTLILTFNAALSDAIVRFSDIAPYLETLPLFWTAWLHLLLVTLAMLTLVMFLGTISGGMTFQLAFSLIFTLFPIGFGVLVMHFADVHNLDAYGMFSQYGRHLLGLSLLPNLFSVTDQFWLGFDNAVYALPYFVFLPWAIALYRHNRVEYNGRMLIFDGGIRLVFVIGIVACFGMLGGFISTGVSASLLGLIMGGPTRNLLSYYVGFVTFALASYWTTRKWLDEPRHTR